MTVVTSDLIRRIPKAELHCHLDGSVRPATMLDLAREQGKLMPRDDADALREFMRVDDAHDLEEYLERFSYTLAVMQQSEAIERIAYELAEDAAAEGIRYLETRFSPVLNVHEGLSGAQVLEAALRGLQRAERDHGIVARMVVCAIRNMPSAMSLELARLAVDHRDAGVAGFDLAGGERGNPASVHAEAFAHCQAHGLACTCHAGEGDGAQSVALAMHSCHATRIGHGTHLIDDPALMAEARTAGVAIECCLTSNVQTRAVASYDTHPLRAYFDAGLKVSINTDNRLMSGTDLVAEYGHAARHLGFTFDELTRLGRQSFEHAFLPEQGKRALLARVDADIAALRREVA